MEQFLLRVAVSAVAVLAASQIFPQLEVASLEQAIAFGVVLGVFNAFVRPILLLITLPLNLVTLGLFTLVVNAVVFWLATQVPVGVRVHGLGGVLIGTLSVSLVSWLASRASQK
ncbi:MAG TPA: phage holin family protein [Chloroflexota bacterium]